MPDLKQKYPHLNAFLEMSPEERAEVSPEERAKVKAEHAQLDAEIKALLYLQ
jgi:hypothetical protein